MNAVGIVAEYNPFHNGHKYQLNAAKERAEADISVAVISGNFVQRGEPAILDKMVRTEMALNEGIDLVVEMPTIFAMNNSEYFAKAGVEILESLGCKYIAFGSETGDIEVLKNRADRLKSLSSEDEEKIKSLVKEGLSYPRALNELLSSSGNDSESLGPNDILAVSYIKNMTAAKPIAVKREGAGHIETATHLRNIIYNGKSIEGFVPPSTSRIYEENRNNAVFSDMFFDLIIQKILSSTEEELNSVFGAEEGLGSKLKRNVRNYKSFDDIANDLKSKRYTRTRINRVIFSVLLGITKEDVKSARNYGRILGFSENGAKYLKKIRRDDISEVPIITNINKEKTPEIEKTLRFDILATDLYNLAGKKDLYENSENVKKPLKL